MSFRKKVNSYSVPVKFEINYLAISEYFTWNNRHHLIFRSKYKRRLELRKFKAHNIFNGAMSNDGARNVELAITFIPTALP
jgi:hypothetical protein